VLTGSGCGSRISFSLSVTLGDRHFMTYCHSPWGGDTAAALADRAFLYSIMSTHHRATMQQPCGVCALLLLLPTGLSAGQRAGISFISRVQKWGFHPAGARLCTDKCVKFGMGMKAIQSAVRRYAVSGQISYFRCRS